jgi:hypothetical protein
MTVNEYLREKYNIAEGRSLGTILAAEAKIFGIPGPLQPGWGEKYGDIVITEGMAYRLRQSLEVRANKGQKYASIAVGILDSEFQTPEAATAPEAVKIANKDISQLAMDLYRLDRCHIQGPMLMAVSGLVQKITGKPNAGIDAQSYFALHYEEIKKYVNANKNRMPPTKAQARKAKKAAKAQIAREIRAGGKEALLKKNIVIIKKTKVKPVTASGPAQGRQPTEQSVKSFIDNHSNVDPTSDDFLNTFEWKAVRMMALKKHGYRCLCCGASPATGAVIHVDHIKPRKFFPALALDVENLQTLCGDCNMGKGNWLQEDFRAAA